MFCKAASNQLKRGAELAPARPFPRFQITPQKRLFLLLADSPSGSPCARLSRSLSRKLSTSSLYPGIATRVQATTTAADVMADDLMVGSIHYNPPVHDIDRLDLETIE